MATSYGPVIRRSLGKAVKNPIAAVKLLRRRLFPFGIVPRDPEAYRIGSWSYGGLKREPAVAVFPGIERVDVTVFRPFDRDIATSIDILELVVLCSIVRLRDSKRILEIGTYTGNTTLNLAANGTEDMKITTVDLPENWPGTYEKKVPALYENVTDLTKVGIEHRGHPEYAGRITQIYGDSARLDWDSLGGPFDLVFIDGNHHHTYVASDTENALRHLTPGGLLVWHDYGMVADVSHTVDTYRSRLELHAIRGTRLAFGFGVTPPNPTV